MTSTPIGKSRWDLDTPALCVDLDKMERNVATLQAKLKKKVASRPHAKTHKTADIGDTNCHRINWHLLRESRRGRSSSATGIDPI